MRIVFIGPFSLYPKGTVSVRMLSLARELKAFGHEVIVLLPPYDNPKYSGTQMQVDGIALFNVNIPSSRLPIKYLFVAGDLVRKSLNLRPDILHVFKPKGYSGLAGIFLVLLKFTRFVKVPLFLDTDDLEGYGGFADFLFEHGLYSSVVVSFFDFQEKWLLEHVDGVTAASKVLEAKTIGLRDDRGRKTVFYIPNGPTLLGKGSGKSINEIKTDLGIGEKLVILLYTRFFEYDVDEVVDILERVVRRFDNFVLLVVGKGEFGEDEKLLKLAKAKGLLPWLRAIGWVKPELIPDYIRISDIAIYPFKDTLLNRSKSPGKLVQLMSYGKAIVADDVGQISKCIEHGKSGILVTPGETSKFANWVLRLLVEKDLRSTLGINAIERVRTAFNWEQLAKQVEKAYKVP